MEIPLYHERFLAYVSPDHPAYAQESIRMEIILEQPVWIIRGGITIIPETHTNFILYSQQECLRPIVDPVPSRTVSLIIRTDFIHEAKLNAVVDAIKRIIPGNMQESVLCNGPLKL